MNTEIQFDIGYKRNILYRDIQIRIPETGVISFIGGKGSGKSTLYKTLLGMIPPLKGHLSQCLLNQIANVYDYIGLPEEVTVRNILHLLEKEKIKFAKEAYTELDRFIMEFSDHRILSLSSGQRRIVELYAALSAKKRIIILDEASNTLDFLNRAFFLNHVKRLSGSNIVLLHSSQDINDVFIS